MKKLDSEFLVIISLEVRECQTFPFPSFRLWNPKQEMGSHRKQETWVKLL